MAAVEVLVATPAVRHVIREDKLHQLYSVMQSRQSEVGMQTLNQDLAALVRDGHVAFDVALAFSSNPDELRETVARRAGAGRVRPRGSVSPVG